MTWNDLGEKTWGDLSGEPSAPEIVTQDEQETIERLIAMAETLTARMEHLEATQVDLVRIQVEDGRMPLL